MSEELEELERLFADLPLWYKHLYAVLRQLHKEIGVDVLGGQTAAGRAAAEAAARLLLEQDIAEDETDPALRQRMQSRGAGVWAGTGELLNIEILESQH
jgi:hypothetical protein